MNKNVKSPKEISLEKKLLAEIDPKRPAYKIAQLLINDAEIEAIQDYANTVSIVRLGLS
jgi:hypothetical protein